MKILIGIGIFLLYPALGILIIAIVDRFTPIQVDVDDSITIGICSFVWPVVLLICLFVEIGVIGSAVLKTMRNRGNKKKGQE